MGLGLVLVIGMIIALSAALAMMGAGCWISRDEGATAWAHALIAGLLVWGLVGLALGLMGQLTPAAFSIVAGMSLFGWSRARIAPPPWVALVPALLLAAPALIDATGSLTGVDELYLHGGLSQQLAMHEGLLGGVLHPNGSRPLTLQLVYTGLWSTGHPSSLSSFHWILAVALLTLVIQLGRLHLGALSVGLIAAAVLGGSTTVQESIGQAASDLPTAFAVLAAMDASLRRNVRLGIASAAVALSIKYTAAAPLVGIALAARLPLPTIATTVMGAGLLVSPWWLRNAFESLHPLFPFTGWPDPSMAFQSIEKWGAGRTVADFARLPYRAVFEADPQTHRFHGRLHPFMLACVLMLPVACRPTKWRPWAIAGITGSIGWAMGPHWLRYLIPTLPILALSGSAIVVWVARNRLGLGMVWCGLIGLAPMGLIGTDRHLSRELTVRTSSDEHTPTVVEFCNRHVPEDATVALLFAWEGAAIQRRQLLGSVEDHIPSRHFILSHPTDPLGGLRRAGATHVLIGNVDFRRQLYPTIPEADFDAEYRKPVSTINHHLLMGADLLFSTATHRLYRLPADGLDT